ncbi:MAG: tetratricopeptide repeat protein [Bdellovibrionales bacterium]|nr:tetratricopeptide repeat protein [Bdellovibrionales bacterium]
MKTLFVFKRIQWLDRMKFLTGKKLFWIFFLIIFQLNSIRVFAAEDQSLNKALQLAKSGKYKEASVRLFQLSLSPRYQSRRMQIKYILGLMLYQMKLNQIAAFQFISVVKDGKSSYLKQSLEKLSLVADTLGDDTLLNYAISKIKVDEFPRVHRDMLLFRIGEFQLRNSQFSEAAKSFARVNKSSPLYAQAKYQEGLALALAKNPGEAVSAFEELIQFRESAGIVDEARVSGLLGKARALYQKKDWDGAIEAYREVPVDTLAWHDTLFESSWAMLRSGRFRSALSNFQSLHSSFYEDFYLPESLLLRSIVYLYICKYNEMEKVLNLFNKIYRPVYKSIEKNLENEKDTVKLFNEVVKVMRDYKIKGEEIDRNSYQLPFLVVRKISREGDFQNSFQYVKKLLDERKRIQRMPADWQNSSLGKYSKKILQTRIQKARKRAGGEIKIHLEAIREELFDLFEQEGFIRYEMINGKKESLKKNVAGKDAKETQVDEKNERDYYVQNGYEYWPFRGEYWLDEIGNYHYVGTQSCE